MLISQGRSISEVYREFGVLDATYYKWSKEYGGMGMDQARRLKELELENKRLRRAVSDLTLDNQPITAANSPPKSCENGCMTSA